MKLATALFRAFDIHTLDYPWEAAIHNALEWCDEVVVVAGTNSLDMTCASLYDLQNRNYGRVFVVPTHFHFEHRYWQESWWNLASSYAKDSEWLIWLDLDELVADPQIAREALENSTHALLNFEFVHLFGTAGLANTGFALTDNTRAGRQRVQYRLMNREGGAACAAVYGPAARNAHFNTAPGWVRVKTPILHYGWCRDPEALSISQKRHRVWYDLEVAEPWPVRHEFNLRGRYARHTVLRHSYEHPKSLQPWLDSHNASWMELEKAAGIDA